MAFSGSRRRNRSFRFRGRPFARKELLWVNTALSFTEVAGSTSRQFLINASEWIQNPTVGNMQDAKILRLNLFISAPSLATAESRLFNLFIEDVSATGGLNPLAVATYAQLQPFHQGILFSPANTAAAGPVPLFNGHPDNLRSYKVNRKVSSSQSLMIDISPAAAAGNQLTFTVLARALVQFN